MLGLDPELIEQLKANRPRIAAAMPGNNPLSRMVMDEMGLKVAETEYGGGPATRAFLESRPYRKQEQIRQYKLQGMDLPGHDELRMRRMESEQERLATASANELSKELSPDFVQEMAAKPTGSPEHEVVKPVQVEDPTGGSLGLGLIGRLLGF